MRTPGGLSARACALRSLMSVLKQGKNLDYAIQSVILESANPADKPFIQALVYGVLRNYFWLEAAVATLLQKPLKTKDFDIMVLLLMGIYEQKAMNTPVYASINETVSVCKKLKKPWARSLVNAVLRRYSREKSDFTLAMPSMVSQYNHPLWLIKQIQQDWPTDWEAIVNANLSHPPMHLRVNIAKTEPKAYRERLKSSGINAEMSPFCETTLTLDTPVDVSLLPKFAEGFVSVQDLGAQMAANLLVLGPNMRVLDACAAPGGKTCHILELAPTTSLSALELNPKRMARVKENLTRLALTARLLTANANQLDAWYDGKAFDRILLDAPCSATGVIRRHPDILHLRQPQDIKALAKEQLALLTTLWKTLKPGGLLLYVTCSVLNSENDGVIEKFLTAHNEAVVVELPSNIGKKTVYGRQLLPENSSTDGFYYAKLMKGEG